MPDVTLPIAVADSARSFPLWTARPGSVEALIGGFADMQSAWLRATTFKGEAQQLALFPSENGIAGAVLGLGEDRSPYAFGDLATRLPAGTVWRLEPGDYDPAAATLGFCLGAYAFRHFKEPKRAPALLLPPPGTEAALREAEAIWMVRDLINTPANLLGPAELADAAERLAKRFGAAVRRAEGAALEDAYPAVAAVGRGSSRPPVVLTLHWHGSKATENAAFVSLCGKGVVFDTGGYDIKPSAGMLRMKKDMGGAATVLGLAQLIMQSDLPVRLAVRIGCVENSISGSAMRPSDIIKTRRGLSVEIGNTDAEGRLVLADLLAEASDEHPDLLIDCATLTGAARVALGPDIPALFCNDENISAHLVAAGRDRHDPVWPLPLWTDYGSWLDSSVADLNNVGTKPMAGAVTAALFLRRFIAAEVPWIHLDLYAWNDQSRPGRPEGGEAHALRALANLIANDEFVTRPIGTSR